MIGKKITCDRYVSAEEYSLSVNSCTLKDLRELVDPKDTDIERTLGFD